jgi:hypothetical protein
MDGRYGKGFRLMGHGKQSSAGGIELRCKCCQKRYADCNTPAPPKGASPLN